MDKNELYYVETTSKVQVSPRNGGSRRISTSASHDRASTHHVMQSPGAAVLRTHDSMNGISPLPNANKWIQEDLDAEEEAIKFLHTQTKLVERLKKELSDQSVELGRLQSRIKKQDSERAEVTTLYEELRELERRYRKREEDQARREGEAAAREEHYEALHSELRSVQHSLERDLHVAEERNRVLEEDLQATREQLSLCESRNATTASQQRNQIASLEAQCERYRMELEGANSRLENMLPTFEEETQRLREALDDARRDADAKLFELSRLEEKHALMVQAKSELEFRANQAIQKARDAKGESDGRRSQILHAEEEMRRAQEELAHARVELDTVLHREELNKQAGLQREDRLKEEAQRWAGKCAELEADLLRCWQEVKRAQEEEVEARRIQEVLTQKRLNALHRRHAAEERLRDALVEVVTESVSPPRRPEGHARAGSIADAIHEAKQSPTRGFMQNYISVSLNSPVTSPSRGLTNPGHIQKFETPTNVHIALAKQHRLQQLAATAASNAVDMNGTARGETQTTIEVVSSHRVNSQHGAQSRVTHNSAVPHAYSRAESHAANNNNNLGAHDFNPSVRSSAIHQGGQNGGGSQYESRSLRAAVEKEASNIAASELYQQAGVSSRRAASQLQQQPMVGAGGALGAISQRSAAAPSETGARPASAHGGGGVSLRQSLAGSSRNPLRSSSTLGDQD